MVFRNHKFFYFYVLFTDLDFLFHFILGIVVVALEYQDMDQLKFFEGESKLMVAVFSLFIGAFCGLLFLALTPLLYVQTINLITGLTTNDRFAKQTNGIRESRTSAFSIPFIESEQIPASLLEAASDASSIVREIKNTCFCFNKTVSLIKNAGYEEMQRTSTIRD
jgi:predicted PurR-regulated permease PerM